MLRSVFVLRKGVFSTRNFHVTNFAALGRVVERVPALGESITEGTIAAWKKEEGEKIKIDDVVVIVETDKVTVDIKSTRSGVLTKKLAKDTVSSSLL
jgi:acetyl/propionyl-CoA carboxylase alpha subunit